MMNLSIFRNLLLLFVVGTCYCTNQALTDPNIVNTKVERVIDISTHVAKITTTISLTNKGKSAVKNFVYSVDTELCKSLSYIGAWQKDQEDNQFQISEVDQCNRRIVLASALQSGKTENFVVETVFTHILKPYPTQILQSEKQFVKFTGNIFYYSPYQTTQQGTKITLASSTIETYTKHKPVSTSDNTITYGPYKDKEPFAEKKLEIHSENNTPFLTVTKLTRTIEISHWGNIAVEEILDIEHSGAKLKGPFSRYDYQRNQDGFSSIKSLKTILPSSANNVYYRDEIGNISTSSMKNLVDSVELELRPRFPLFGGWKTHYYIGYNIPSYEYLYVTGDKYSVQMRFVDHIYDDMVIDSVTLKIILPEGSKDINFVSPFSVKKEAEERHYTYLDTVGRPVMVFSKTNLVEAHIQDFQLNYTFQKLLLLQEPLLVTGAFYLLFLTIIIYVRMDFSITKDEARESRMRVSSLIDQIQSTNDKRSALYQSYSDAINKYKASKDNASFQAQKKKIDADHKELTQQITAMQNKLKTENAELSDKVTQAQKLDQQYKELLTVAVSYAEKLVSGKMNKSQYLDMDATNEKKRNDILSKMEDIIVSL